MQPLTGSRAALRLMRPQDHDSGMATPRVRATVKAAAAPSSGRVRPVRLHPTCAPDLATRGRHGVQVQSTRTVTWRPGAAFSLSIVRML